MNGVDVPTVAVLVAVAWVVWQILDGAAWAVGRLVHRDRPDVAERLVDEVQALHDVVNGYGHDTLQEAESLREVAEAIRDDDRAGLVLAELRQFVAAVERLAARDGGAR